MPPEVAATIIANSPPAIAGRIGIIQSDLQRINEEMPSLTNDDLLAMIPEDLSTLSEDEIASLEENLMQRIFQLENSNRKLIEFWQRVAPTPADMARVNAENTISDSGIQFSSEYVSDWIRTDQFVRSFENIANDYIGMDLELTSFGIYPPKVFAAMTELKTEIDNLITRADYAETKTQQKKLLPRIKVLIGNAAFERMDAELQPYWSDKDMTADDTAPIISDALTDGMNAKLNEMTNGAYAHEQNNIAVEDQMLVKLAKDNSEAFLEMVLALPERYAGRDGKYSALRKLIPNFNTWWKSVEAWLKFKGVEKPNVPEQHKLMDDVAPFAAFNTEIECR